MKWTRHRLRRSRVYSSTLVPPTGLNLKRFTGDEWVDLIRTCVTILRQYGEWFANVIRAIT